MTRAEARRRGLVFYSTGRECGRRHTPNRYASTGGCVECTKLTAKVIYDADRDEINRKGRARYRANSVRYGAMVKRWQSANKERYKAMKKRWLAETLNGYLCRKINGIRTGCRSSGRRRRKITCEIVPSNIRTLLVEQGGRCALTGRELEMDSKPGNLNGLSVDRIDPTKSYTPDNIRLTTYQANQARMAGTDDELLEFCRDIVKHLAGRKRRRAV